MQEHGLIRKLKLISKFLTSQTGQQIITIHILQFTANNSHIAQYLKKIETIR